MNVHESFLVYRQFRFLKLSLGVVALAMLAYLMHTPPVQPNGGTWLGYTLGSVTAVLVLWMLWFGVRKRSYKSGVVRLQTWLSAHVYLGVASVVLATLHCGGQFGYNVHTLTYIFLLITVISGIYGVYAYRRYPEEMSANRAGATVEEILSEIADLDAQCRDAGMSLSQQINEALMKAIEKRQIGGSLSNMLSGRNPRCLTTAARELVAAEAERQSGSDSASLNRLLALLVRKEELLARARRHVQIRAILQVWLFVHVPAAVGLLAALIAHVVAVFFYW